jgi:hypothetical protein
MKVTGTFMTPLGELEEIAQVSSLALGGII